VLHIKLRPKKFSEIIGLDDQVKSLETKIASGDIPRCFLLTGPFGTGKTTLAYIIARAIQGWDFPDELPPQVQEINAAHFTGINDMRNLVNKASSYPMVGKYSVIILDEAHKLSAPAQQLLLKEFEAPDSPTVWIICTTDPQKLAAGIRAGRCFTVTTAGMGAVDDRKALLARAAQDASYTGDWSGLLAELDKARVTSPRKIVTAFEAFASGQVAAVAVAGQTLSAPPEYFDIVFTVLYGNWEVEVPDFRDKTKKLAPASKLLFDLDERLKKHTKLDAAAEEAAGESTEKGITDEDLEEGSKTEAAQALKLIAAAFLRNRILKNKRPAQAAEALGILANAVPPGAFGMEWPLIIAALYRVNKLLSTKV
jgi:SpoVK/Ycf46/Vps4 family AAA+-type ATPase